MSKTIDLSDGVGSLSDDDLFYLAQRDNAEALAELESRGLTLAFGGPPSIDQVPHTGDANTRGETIEELEARLARMKAEQGSESDDDEEDEEDEEELDYASMSNDDLRAEIARRNEGRDEADQLSLEGRKADLIATLEADDEDEE